MVARDVLLAEVDITVVDSRSISMGLGFMAIAAAEAIHQGASPQEAVARAIEARKDTCLYASHIEVPGYERACGPSGGGHGEPSEHQVYPHPHRGETGNVGADPQPSAVLETGLGTDPAVDRRAPRQPHGHPPYQRPDRGPPIRRASALCPALCPEEIVIAELTPGLSVHTGAGLIGLVTVAST